MYVIESLKRQYIVSFHTPNPVSYSFSSTVVIPSDIFRYTECIGYLCFGSCRIFVTKSSWFSYRFYFLLNLFTILFVKKSSSWWNSIVTTFIWFITWICSKIITCLEMEDILSKTKSLSEHKSSDCRPYFSFQ